MRAAFRTVGRFAPGVAARWAEAVFCRPPSSVARPLEERFLETGTRFTVDDGLRPIAAWSWGSGPTVVFVHGWGSRAGRFATLVPPLVAAGLRAVVYDGPAHGATPGTRASLPEFAAALKAVAAQVGPLHAAVGHSLGAAAVVVAMRDGLAPGRVVLIAPPADLIAFSHRFAELVRLPAGVRDRMQSNLETRFQDRWDNLNVERLARRMTVPLLVVHDRDDPDVAVSEGAAIAAAWRGATFVETAGLGHRAILRDPDVVRRVTEFVRQ